MRNHIGRPRADFDISGSDHTFILTQTTLDYILCSNSVCSYVNIYHVYEEGLFSSTSDHLPVLMSIDIQPKNRTSNKSLNCLPAWHKADSCKIDSFPKELSACWIEISIVLFISIPSVLISPTWYTMLIPKPFQSQIQTLPKTGMDTGSKAAARHGTTKTQDMD